MLNMIYSIPENIGWIIVGTLATLCVITTIKLVKIGIEMYHDHKENQ